MGIGPAIRAKSTVREEWRCRGRACNGSQVDKEGSYDHAREHADGGGEHREGVALGVVKRLLNVERQHRLSHHRPTRIAVGHDRGEGGGEVWVVYPGEPRDDAGDDILAEDHNEAIEQVLSSGALQNISGRGDGRAQEKATEDDVGAEAGEHCACGGESTENGGLRERGGQLAQHGYGWRR